MPIVYGSLLSPYVRKVLIVLELKNISYEFVELHPLIPEQKQKLLKLSPLGKIPIYQDNDLVLPDSSVISAYLEKKFPMQISAEDYARSLWFEEYADTYLTPTIITIFVNTITAPALGFPVDQAALNDALTKKLPQIFGYLNQTIATKNFFVNNEMTIADISMLSAFMSYKLLVCDEIKKWPELAAYVKKGLQSEVVKKIFIKFTDVFEKKYGKVCVQ